MNSADASKHIPWCVLCGQRHPMESQCDPKRLEWLRSLRGRRARILARFHHRKVMDEASTK